MENTFIKWFNDIRSEDIALVGGKNASLGEMITTLSTKGVKVPEGFAVTAQAYREFIEANQLGNNIHQCLGDWDAGKIDLSTASQSIRKSFSAGHIPDTVKEPLLKAYRRLCEMYPKITVAVRSSATAEDLPGASFAGQQETFLNISNEEGLLESCKNCFSSLFTARAISYRKEKGFDHFKVALSIGVQRMVRSDKASSGVMFTLDPETGFPKVVLITAAWGLGETIVGGLVDPDEYLVFKPLLDKKYYLPILKKTCGSKKIKAVYNTKVKNVIRIQDTSEEERSQFALSDKDILILAKWATIIEEHYGLPMDIEWAKDGETNELFIVQARPETVQSKKRAASLNIYSLKDRSQVLTKGLAIGEAISSGQVCVIKDPSEVDKFIDNAILVTEMTDPDWGPILVRASAIITDKGGRTAHAAIVSRELGIPAIVGTQDATQILHSGQNVTLSCAEGSEGIVYEGILDYEKREIQLEDIPKIRTPIMLNIANPAAAFRWYNLPCQGIGLVRMEFIIANIIKIHPLALLDPSKVSKSDYEKINQLTSRYTNKPDYFIDQLAEGIAQIASAQFPYPVIVRMSDFKTNEYANLTGGKTFEPIEDNPMLGFRGASRYYSKEYRAGFSLECRAIRKAREIIGLHNIIVMIPFCRTLKEADRVVEVMKEEGLERGKDGLEIYVMAEIPSNIILAEQFADRFDGFSIGSNDLTQLTLGVDRDSAKLAHLFDERNDAIKQSIIHLIEKAHKKNRKVGICGQAPSDYPDFAEFLVKSGIDSISLTPDSVLEVIQHIAQVEKLL